MLTLLWRETEASGGKATGFEGKRLGVQCLVCDYRADGVLDTLSCTSRKLPVKEKKSWEGRVNPFFFFENLNVIVITKFQSLEF